MPTADTITDEQIRELRDALPLIPSPERERLRWVVGCALGEPGYFAHARQPARARCAEVLNARTSCECGHPRESHDLDDACASCQCRSFNARATRC